MKTNEIIFFIVFYTVLIILVFLAFYYELKANKNEESIIDKQKDFLKQLGHEKNIKNSK